MITQEFLPRNEQALRALDALTDAAALEVEEVSDDRYNCDRGLELLIEDLSVAFCEKELFRRGGLIREYESLTRMQGESVTAFVRRFRLYERKLKDAKLEPYPDETRAIKLLDGLKLDERATSSLLLAATNRYNFDPLIEAIRVQYPAVLTLPDGIVTTSSRCCNRWFTTTRPRLRWRFTRTWTWWQLQVEDMAHHL